MPNVQCQLSKDNDNKVFISYRHNENTKLLKAYLVAVHSLMSNLSNNLDYHIH